MMAPPSFIYFILIQSCIWRIWFLIESLCSNPPLLSTEAYSMIYITYQIFQSLAVKYFTQTSSLYCKSLGPTSSSQCIYAKLMGLEGAAFFADLFLKNKSSVLETCNTRVITLVCKVLFRLGSDMWNFFLIFQSFSSPSHTVKMYTV